MASAERKAQQVRYQHNIREVFAKQFMISYRVAMKENKEAEFINALCGRFTAQVINRMTHDLVDSTLKIIPKEKPNE